MDNLEIVGTDKTPFVSFDVSKGQFSIWGNSIPEDTLNFYKTIFDWLEEYKMNAAGATELNITLEYFNTSSSKCLYTIFKKLQDVSESGRAVQINWHYKLEDTDMYESGMDFKNILSVPFAVERIKQ